MRISLADSLAVALQNKTGEHVKALTIIALLFLPVTTTSTIFSVDAEVLPFSLTFKNYIITTLCLTAVLVTVLTVVLKWTWLEVVKIGHRGTPRRVAGVRLRDGSPDDRLNYDSDVEMLSRDS